LNILQKVLTWRSGEQSANDTHNQLLSEKIIVYSLSAYEIEKFEPLFIVYVTNERYNRGAVCTQTFLIEHAFDCISGRVCFVEFLVTLEVCSCGPSVGKNAVDHQILSLLFPA
jgi:hypothetical protein